MRRSPSILVVVALAAIAGLQCSTPVPASDEADTYSGSIRSLVDASCARCHARLAPAGGIALEGYRDLIGCTPAGRPLGLPTESSLLEEVLSRPSHRGFVSDADRDRLIGWVRSGSPSARASVHPSRFADPRAPGSHVQVLRGSRHRPLFDLEDADRCARCHDGAGPKPAGVVLAAPGATPCTTCHAEPEGALGCTTCHGAPGRPFPPRDRCFFPDVVPDAHAAHAAPSRSRAEGLDCSTCHPKPLTGERSGAHLDDHVEVWFDRELLPRATIDATTKRCAGTCHDRGGARPTPSWLEQRTSLGCNDCHSSPPRDHYAGPCSSCHRETDATGSALAAKGALHVNGRVDLGDGSGTCGACHGSGESPWPTSGAHAAHMKPAGSAPVACETCHAVPGPGEKHPIRAGAPAIRFAGLATKGGRAPSFDAATKTCAGTYCHEGSGAARPGPRWTDGASARTCGSCHGEPPPPPHAQSSTCGASGCHAPPSNATLVNGSIDRAP